MEFGRAGKSCQLSTIGILRAYAGMQDCRKTGQLLRSIYQGMQADPLHQWENGRCRMVISVCWKAHDFNARKKLAGVLKQRVETEMNGITGICSVTIPSFLPYKQNALAIRN